MILHGDCLDEMKKMPDNHFSCILTDPPYGLSFMGKGWDHAVPGIEYWKECLRITKPGGHLLAMGGTRTFHRLTSSIEDSGFEIRDCLMWIYGSGFPKSHNQFGCDGYGTALKPAYEPIIMAMKPCDGTFKQNAEKWGQAGINIDGCRIPTTDKFSGGATKGISSMQDGWDRPWKHNPEMRAKCAERASLQAEKSQTLGRWPANVIFDEEAAKMLDEQSGQLKSGSIGPINHAKSNEVYGKFAKGNINEFSASSGGASRFFYVAKTSSRERNEGLEGMPDVFSECNLRTQGGLPSPEKEFKTKNNHPTVKPLKLMRYLITLIMPPKDGILLDPFAGSGSTIIAAHQLGVKAIGIEKQAEYVEIAKKRLEYYKSFKDEKEPDLFDKASSE